MVKTELMKQAIETSHDSCEGDCVHAFATVKNKEQIEEDICIAVLKSVGEGLPADAIFMRVWYIGLHVGYRLRMLEEADVS